VGRRISVTFSRGALTYSYDPSTNNISSVSAPGGVGLNYSYEGSLPTSMSWTGSVQGSVAESYDDNLRVISQSVNGQNAIAFGYDNDDLLTSAGNLTLVRSPQHGLITGTTLGTVTDTRSYNEFLEALSYVATANGNNLLGEQYTYDKLGRITQKTETIEGVPATYSYAYDVAGWLTQVAKDGTPIATYTYDANGNRLTGPGVSTNATYDDQDRLLQYGTNTYTYAASGELTTRVKNGQTATFAYDELGNLTHVSLPGGTQIDYLVDGQGQRIGKSVNGTLVQRLLYSDKLQPVAELDSNNQVVTRFVYGTRENVPEYLIRSGTTYRILTDHLGSPRLVVNTATGLAEQRMDYDAFGNITQDTHPGFQPFGFAGGLYDPDTQLVHFGARDYDPEIGRFTIQDPLSFANGQTNLYAYAAGDPVNLKDPSGLWVVQARQPGSQHSVWFVGEPGHWTLYEFAPNLQQLQNSGRNLSEDVVNGVSLPGGWGKKEFNDASLDGGTGIPKGYEIRTLDRTNPSETAALRKAFDDAVAAPPPDYDLRNNCWYTPKRIVEKTLHRDMPMGPFQNILEKVSTPLDLLPKRKR
jgi:RHS repeat-associated protein